MATEGVRLAGLETQGNHAILNLRSETLHPPPVDGSAALVIYGILLPLHVTTSQMGQISQGLARSGRSNEITDEGPLPGLDLELLDIVNG